MKKTPYKIFSIKEVSEDNFVVFYKYCESSITGCFSVKNGLKSAPKISEIYPFERINHYHMKETSNFCVFEYKDMC